MDSLKTCPASEVFMHSMMATRRESTASVLAALYSTSDILIRWLLTVLSWPMALVFKGFYLFTISPIAFFYRLFVKAFETVITPIFYFAAIAGFVGAIGGLIVGGLTLIVQWMIPVQDYNMVRAQGKAAGSNALQNNKLTKKKSTETMSDYNDNENDTNDTDQESIVPSTFTAVSSPDGDVIMGYEDEDGYTAYTPRRVSFPRTPPPDNNDVMAARDTFVHYFSPIREEPADDSAISSALDLKYTLKTSAKPQLAS